MAKQYYIRKTDDQTIDPTSVPATNTGTVLQMLGRLANRIKAITGKTNWYDWPTVTLEDAATHHGRTDNPHSATAAQTGALVSVDGVSNAGGNVDFVAGTNMTITPDDTGNTVTFAAGGSSGIASVDGVSNAGGNVDFVAGTGMTITPDDTANTVTFASSGGGSSQPFPDNTALVKNNTDNTKLVRVDAAAVATGVTRVLTMPNKNVDLAAIPATDVTNTPAGNIAATTVQAALNELDAEKATPSQIPAVASQAQADAGTDNTTILTPLRFDSSAQLKARTTFADVFSDFVVSGFNPSLPGATLTMTTPAGVAYILGSRVSIAADTSRAYTASRDTYLDVNASGTYTAVAVTNGAAEPAVTSNSLRLLKVVTSGTQVTAITQRSRDIYSKVPIPNFSAYRTAAQAISATTFTIIQHNTIDTDSHGWFDTTTWKFTPQIPGLWMFYMYGFVNAAVSFFQYVNKNSGTRFQLVSSATCGGMAAAAPLFMNGTTDFAQHEMYLGTGASTQAGLGQCQFGAYYLGKSS